MAIGSLLDVLRLRAPWRTVASPLLKRAGFTVTRGIDETLDAIRTGPVSVAQLAAVDTAVREHMVAGEKLIRLYKLQAPDRQALLNWGNSLKVAQSPLAKSFLTVAPANVLAASVQSPPQFVATYDHPDGLAIVFTSARSFMERVPLPRASLDASLNPSQYDAVYGIRKTYAQTYDVIWIAYGQDLVCIATDAPEKAPVDFGSLSQDALQAFVTTVLKKKQVPLNLWPAVDGIYKAPGGQCVELGFLTDTESVKFHKARRGLKCLRQDRYHVGGAHVVGSNLQPYRVAMRWVRSSGVKGATSHPEIQLPGGAKMIFGANANLDHAFVRHTLDIADFEFVIDQLSPFI